MASGSRSGRPFATASAVAVAGFSTIANDAFGADPVGALHPFLDNAFDGDERHLP